MKNLINKIVIGIGGILCLAMIYGFYTLSNISLTHESRKSETINKTLSKTLEAKKYCKENNFNEEFCILIDMSMHSGKNRFRVYDFEQKKVIQSFPVSHGCGNNTWGAGGSAENPSFSNTVDSHLSSLGKYKIGERGWSSFGVNINYRLHGLDETNSNANKRDIVFHSWEWISDDEIYPAGNAEGWGCPAISNDNFNYVDKLLKSQTKPTLMWIYK